MRLKKRTKQFIVLNTVLVLGLAFVILLGIVTMQKFSNKTIEAFENDSEYEKGSLEQANSDSSNDVNEDIAEKETEPETIAEEDVFDTITISAAGDVTLGRDESYGYELSFDHEFEVQNQDYGYFFRNVKDIFEQDDITIVNLETTLTNATEKADKTFRFKADPSYVEILKQGDIEAVNIANNHTHDYLEQGYLDTVATLENAGVGYFGYEHKYITDVRDIKVGFLGFTAWNESQEQKDMIKQSIEDLRNEGADLVIITYHWGIELDNIPNSVQRNMAHFSIDSGADLVLGGHPHVLQGIEEYKGKQIVYSLGNFSFGGNRNPKDHDTMIYVHKFNFKNGELISDENEVIPCSISSVSDRNNYQPTPLEGEEKQRVLERISEFSEPLK